MTTQLAAITVRHRAGIRIQGCIFR